MCLFLAIGTLLPASLSRAERLTGAETERATHAIHTWLESEDFDEGDLNTLIRYGEAVVPSLIAALSAGPSPARRERLRRSLDADYSSLAERARKQAGRKVPSRDDYLGHYLGNFEALYRVRAAQALAAIGGPDARKALEAAVGRAARADVRAVIEQALKEIK